jgi:hypothetical protein
MSTVNLAGSVFFFGGGGGVIFELEIPTSLIPKPHYLILSQFQLMAYFKFM